MDVLKALAVCEGVDLAIIDQSLPPADRTMVYPADGEHQTRFFSWASSLAPRLRKRHAGMELGYEPQGGRGGFRRPVRPLRVLTYNGTNHYNATRRLRAQEEL